MRTERLEVANGGTTTGELGLEGDVPVSVLLPQALTSTALTFETKTPEGDWVTVADGAGADVSKTVAADKAIILAPADFSGLQNIRLVFGSAEGAKRVVHVNVRAFD